VDEQLVEDPDRCPLGVLAVERNRNGAAYGSELFTGTLSRYGIACVTGR
jgi:hypothetical protein